jgi:hypothetical protein
MLRRLAHWLQPIALLLAGVAILWFLWIQWPALRSYAWAWDARWFGVACAAALASWLLEVNIWRRLLADMGGGIPVPAGYRVWFLSAVVRYIPGNIWQPLSLTLYGKRYGNQPEAVITSVILYQVITLLAAAPIVVVYFTWLDHTSAAALWLVQLPRGLVWVALGPILLFLARPHWLTALLDWALVRMGRPPLQARLRTGTLLWAISVALVGWLLWGITFMAITYAVADASVIDRQAMALPLITAYPIAYAVGFLSLLTPSGFGVREGVLLLLLSPPLSAAVVTVIALATRIAIMVGELLLALLAAPFERAAAGQATTPDARLHTPTPHEGELRPADPA